MNTHIDDDAFITREDIALLTDQYQLTMLRGYMEEDLTDQATFSLFVRSLPESRNYYIAAGLENVLHYLENLKFSDDALEYLSTYEEFSGDFLYWLSDFTFTGNVRALPEGTPFFAQEPILEVEAPLPEAQLVETFLMNQIHAQTVLASKASRIVQVADDASVVDFGLRRMHGLDAGLNAARAFHIAGCTATSNVLAGKKYNVPVTGTMAHSYIQSHDNEYEAFRQFAKMYPDTILLVDTYDTIQGIGHVIDLADEMGEKFNIRGIRLDSGDLVDLAKKARRMLDDAGLKDVKIFASGGLDEYTIQKFQQQNAPIDGYGVGTRMGVSRDLPSLDIAYKLTEYAGTGRLKLSSGKKIYPGKKQIFRDDHTNKDVIALADQELDGRPLLQHVMENGQRLSDAATNLEQARERRKQELNQLPDHLRTIEPTSSSYDVKMSSRLKNYQREVEQEMKSRHE